MQNVNVAKLRGGRVTLSFPSLEEAMPWIKGLEFEFKKIMLPLIVALWSMWQFPKVGMGALPCYGVPLNGWDLKNFEDVGWRLGKLEW